MALIKQGAFSFLHVNQSDTPQPGTATPAGFKAMLDSQAQELKTVLNTNVDALSGTTDGSSNIGSPPLVQGGSTNVMGQLSYLKTNLDLKENADNITVNRKLSAAGDFTGTISGTTSATISASSLEVTGARGGFANLNLRLNGLVTDIGARETSSNLTAARKLSAAGDFTGTVNGVTAANVSSVVNDVITSRSGFTDLDTRLDQMTTDIGSRESSASLTASRKLSTTGDFTGTINGVDAASVVSSASLASDITNNRKLSPTGDFTGTLNGQPISSTTTGLSSEVTNARTGFPALKDRLDSMAVNVKSYGAKGDGVTDDTVAITNALGTLSANGGTVYFPPGNYRVTSGFVIAQNRVLVGAGKNATTITMDASNKPIFETQGVNVKIQDMKLAYSANQTAADTSSVGIALGGITGSGPVSESVIQNLIIQGAYRGIFLPDAAGTYVYARNNLISNVNIVDAYDYAVHWVGTGGTYIHYNNTLINVRAQFASNGASSNAGGFCLGYHTQLTMTNCSTLFTNVRALNIQNCNAVFIDGFHVEAFRTTLNGYPAVYVDNSYVLFTNLVLRNGTINTSVTTECYMLYVGPNSNVKVDNYYETGITNLGTATAYSIVSEGTSVMKLGTSRTLFATLIYGRGQSNLNTSNRNAVPTTGAWKIGDVIFNSQPTVGGYTGWVCVTAGEFGTGTVPVFGKFGQIS